LSRYILSFVFLFVSLGAGYASIHYYNHYCKSERMNLFENQNQLKIKLMDRIQTHWQKNIENTMHYVQRALPKSQENISKALKVIVSSHDEINQAFYISEEMIYLPQWKKFRFTKVREDLNLAIFENPEFKQAEILEYQYQDYTNAVSVYERFWLENPDNFSAAAALARCLYKLKKHDRAEKIYRQIFKQNPTTQITGDIPLGITSAFQLLNIYTALEDDAALQAFALILYRDFLDEKWELSKSKTDFFKNKIKRSVQTQQTHPRFAKRFKTLLRNERNLESVKNYVRFISKRVIPFIEGSFIQNYRIYLLATGDHYHNFLLIVPHGNNYLVVEINYTTYVQKHLMPWLETLAKDNPVGIRLTYGDQEQIYSPVPDGKIIPYAFSQDFPDLRTDLIFSSSPQHILEATLAKLKLYFIGGYTGLIALLILIYYVLIKQIQFAELKSDFVSHVSHELKTPLTSLRMFSEMLKTKPNLTSKKRRQYYDIMNEESIRLSRLIENLLDISRIERKKSQFIFKPENLNTVLDTALDIFINSIQRGTHKIKTILKTDVTLLVDRNAIIQMVINILDNARKFSPLKSTITIRSTIQDHQAIISIQDHGLGMTSKEINKVFKKFYQVKKAYEDKFKGVGLGLAIVKNIAQAHDAKITIRSEKNKGTTVSVAFPFPEDVQT
jgi:signal transduction histidine kinase